MTLPKAKYIYKRDSKLMRLIARLPFIPKNFMEKFWSTLGQTVYMPNYVDVTKPDWKKRHAHVIAHEDHHRKQFFDYGFILMMLAYIIFPLPFFFSGRWFIERPAYLVTLSHFPAARHEELIEKIVNSLWNNYAWCWPKSLMRRWFLRRVQDL